MVAPEKGYQTGRIHLAGFTEHPSAGLVNQVFGIRQQLFCQSEGGVDMALADEPPGGDDRDPAIPQASGCGQAGQDPAIASPEIFSGDIRSAFVHQVPFRHKPPVVEIESKNPFPLSVVSTVKLEAQDPETQGTEFMNVRFETCANRFATPAGKLPGDATDMGFPDTPEDMPIRIAVESFLDRDPVGIGKLAETGREIPGRFG